MTRISPLIRSDQISISAFLCLITGVFCFGWCGGCCSYGNEQIQVKQIRWIWGRDRCRRGRVGRAHVEKYVLRERVSGQVDRELEISCQTQDLCSRVWKVPVCLPALPLYLSLPPSLCLSPDGIDVNRWRPISLSAALLLSGRRNQGNLKAARANEISLWSKKLHHFILMVFPAPLPDTHPYKWIVLQWASLWVT